MSFESKEVPSPADEAMAKHLGGMEVGGERIVGVQDFADLMHAIHVPFHSSENNTGTLESGDGTVYEYSRTGDASDVTVKRVA